MRLERALRFVVLILPLVVAGYVFDSVRIATASWEELHRWDARLMVQEEEFLKLYVGEDAAKAYRSAIGRDARSAVFLHAAKRATESPESIEAFRAWREVKKSQEKALQDYEMIRKTRRGRAAAWALTLPDPK